MLARMTLPAVGASTCASGSQVCSGNMGTLTAKAMKKAQKSQACSVSPYCARRSEEHTSELQSRLHLVCRLLLEKKKKHQAQNVGIKRTRSSMRTRRLT